VTTEAKANVLPIYFIADESTSMQDDVGELNSGLTSLLDAMHLEGMAAAKVRMSIIGFSNSSRCYLDMADLRQIETLPTLTSSGSTEYAVAFNELYNRINDDIPKLKTLGYAVNRPAVFFLTDGQPTDKYASDWQDPLGRLKDPNFAYRPNIIAFGIGQGVSPQMILDVASKPEFAFVTARGTSTGEAVANFCTTLVQSVVSSGQAAASGTPTIDLTKPEGFTMAIDEV